MCVCTGGRDKRGGPILTFPARSNHDRIKQEDLRKLVTYLSTVPRYAHTLLQGSDIFVTDTRKEEARVLWCAVQAAESNAPLCCFTAADGEQRLICIGMKAAVFAADSSESVTLNSSLFIPTASSSQSEDVAGARRSGIRLIRINNQSQTCPFVRKMSFKGHSGNQFFILGFSFEWRHQSRRCTDCREGTFVFVASQPADIRAAVKTTQWSIQASRCAKQQPVLPKNTGMTQS